MGPWESLGPVVSKRSRSEMAPGGPPFGAIRGMRGGQRTQDSLLL